MKKQTAIRHYKSGAALGRALGVSRQAVSDWPAIVPEGYAYKLHVITGGALAIVPSDYRKQRRASPATGISPQSQKNVTPA